MNATLTCEMNYSIVPDVDFPNRAIEVSSTFDNGAITVNYRVTGGVQFDLEWDEFSTLLNRIAAYKNHLDEMNQMMRETIA